MEDNFSTDGEVGGGGNGSSDNATDGEGWGATGATGRDGERQMKLRSLAR